MKSEVFAPFSPDQVEALNAYQKLGYVHPYTCGRCLAKLVAKADGWHCTAPGCTYTQQWAHAYTADKLKHPNPPPVPKYQKLKRKRQ